MRLASLCIISVMAIGGCESGMGIEGTADLVIRAGQPLYAPGDELTVTVSNSSPRAILINSCGYMLQRETGHNTWIDEAGTMCAPPEELLLRLEPGEGFSESLVTAANVATGRYRFVFDIRAANGSRLPTEQRVSDSFMIEVDP